MNELQYRSFTPDLEVRAKGDGRTIVGIAVPYDQPMRIDPTLVEQFARSAFNDHLGPVAGPDRALRSASRVKFSREHLVLGGTLIGVATLMRDDASGLYGEWRVSKTPAGDETLELVRDGALRQLSVGFDPIQNRQLRGGVTERVKAALMEVAVVLEGAYGELATVGGVRTVAASGVRSVAGEPIPQTPGLDAAAQILGAIKPLPAWPEA